MYCDTQERCLSVYDIGSMLLDDTMPSGSWSKGKTKDTDERVKEMAGNVRKAHLDPALRKKLDVQKLLTHDELLLRLKDSQTHWSLVSPISSYTRLHDRNLTFSCAVGHEATMSFDQACHRFRCKVCHPRKGGGVSNSAYVGSETFYERLRIKHGLDAFVFDATEYKGVNKKITFQCTVCHHVFVKVPRAVLRQAHPCPRCAKGNTNSTCAEPLKFSSRGKTEWLDALNIPTQNRNVSISVGNQEFNVSGLMGATVYEYNMSQETNHTVERAKQLREAGYIVIEMWKSDWIVKRETRRKRT